MSNSIIEVNNLSKSYTISHEGKERYTALRDVMAQKAKKIFSFPSSLRGGSMKQSPYKEEFWALKDVNFNIEQGHRVGIIGRNGAGKSTLLKILSRITEPTTGSIKIKGRVASLLEVGTGFHPELTGRENIFLNGAILGMSRVEIKKHFDAIVDFAGVEKFLDTPVKRYSSGMYVRLAFAVAAHLEPEILIVDEVLAVGDAEFQKKCLGKMEDVSKNDGRTVLFVSHNLSALQSLCNKGILMIGGKIDSIDNTDKVVVKYRNSFKEIDFAAKKIIRSPGEFAEVLSFRVNEKDGNHHVLDISEDIIISFDFNIKKSGLIYVPNLHFTDSNNQYVFVSNAEYQNSPTESGLYTSTVLIPKNTFNTGVITVGLAITSYPNFSVEYFDAAAFIIEVTESNLGLRNTPYTGMYPGPVRFKVQIETIRK